MIPQQCLLLLLLLILALCHMKILVIYIMNAQQKHDNCFRPCYSESPSFCLSSLHCQGYKRRQNASCSMGRHSTRRRFQSVKHNDITENKAPAGTASVPALLSKASWQLLFLPVDLTGFAKDVALCSCYIV